MYNHSSFIALLTLLLPNLISAQCGSQCNSYTSALKTCQTSSKVLAVGTPMDTKTIHCMCGGNTNLTAMNTCQDCWESNPTASSLPDVLFAWITTCTADAQLGDQQAVLCWQNQPDNSIPCYSSSGAVSSAHGGGTVATSTKSAGATSSANR